jgi:hypothetical protein
MGIEVNRLSALQCAQVKFLLTKSFLFCTVFSAQHRATSYGNRKVLKAEVQGKTREAKVLQL